MSEAEKLFHENTRLVYFVLWRYFPTLARDQDLAQEGNIGLWEACLSYDGRVKISTFAVLCIHHAILNELRKRRRAPSMASLDAPLGEGDFSLIDTLVDLKTPNLEEEIFEEDFFFRLGPQDRQLVELLMGGLTKQAAGDATGMSRTTVSRRLKKIRNLYQRTGGIRHAE